MLFFKVLLCSRFLRKKLQSLHTRDTFSFNDQCQTVSRQQLIFLKIQNENQIQIR